MKKIRLWISVTLGSAALFSLFCLSFSGDISLLAFPVSAAFTALTGFHALRRLCGGTDARALPAARKLLQYLPFVLLAAFILRRAGKSGTPYWYDAVTVVLWCAAFVAAQAALYYMNEKRVLKTAPELKARGGKSPARRSGGARVALEILDWADALVQAVFMVLLIQIFIIQLYVIPSESMVPEFLVKDRVVVFKTTSGPKFPLSEVGLPFLRTYRRGDVVVFRNPHYTIDRRSEVRTVLSQIVYMLTFTGVNLNVDETGQPKADPLVKRICGTGGEQLVMQDGVLYARTKDSPQFTAVAADAKFAAWNLNDADSALKRGIQLIPLSRSQYDVMLEVERERRELDIGRAAEECRALASRFDRIPSAGRKTQNAADIPLHEAALFQQSREIARTLLDSADGGARLRAFLTDWTDSAPPDFAGDLYAEANYRLNLMIKLCAGRLLVRSAELAADGAESDSWLQDGAVQSGLTEAVRLHFYVMILDQRNMPVFPACGADGSPNYIPDGCYFMMGDNRFNSLDMRHSYTQRTVPLTKYDRYSAEYDSNMAPQYVNRKYILGTAAYRFWPVSRAGKIAVE